MTSKCPISQETGKSEENKIPCEYCATIKGLGELVSKAREEIKKLEAVIAFEKMKKEYSKLSRSHDHCAGCGLLFGGYHIAKKMQYIRGIGNVCQWCFQDIEKQGVEEFKERMRRQQKEEKTNVK
jgi:hypothetical protein